MTTPQEPSKQEIQEALRRMGYQSETPHVEKPKSENDSDPMASLDIREQLVDTIPLSQEELDGMTPPEKDRIRNMPEGPFGTEEAPEERSGADPWSRRDPIVGNVSASLDELHEYTRALLHDERFELPVTLKMGAETVPARVRSLYMSEREVIALAVFEIAKAHPLAQTASGIPDSLNTQRMGLVSDFYMRCLICCQLAEFEGKPLSPFDARPDEGQLPEDSPKVAALAKEVRLRYANTHQARMLAYRRATQVFEVKQQILEDAFNNGDFPLPAGAY